tara:strand:+ start:1477 stop:2154 length:678 start_codon:yes stop_codon:yes gene_type:complete
MKIFKNKKNLKNELSRIKSISFVPTMGGLHEGHKYLIKKAKARKGKIIVSIFVNPKQFNSKKDFNNYPRNVQKDLAILKKLRIDYVYLPTFNDIYNFKPKNKIYLSPFANKLCGKFRNSHFKGVLDVVNRLIEIINPKYIFFGKKDFQQFFLVREHLKKNKIKTNIIPVKTVRNKLGVAHSSRNKNLNNKDLILASYIYKLIKKEKKKFYKKKLSFNLKKCRKSF